MMKLLLLYRQQVFAKQLSHFFLVLSFLAFNHRRCWILRITFITRNLGRPPDSSSLLRLEIFVIFLKLVWHDLISVKIWVLGIDASIDTLAFKQLWRFLFTFLDPAQSCSCIHFLFNSAFFGASEVRTGVTDLFLLAWRCPLLHLGV